MLASRDAMLRVAVLLAGVGITVGCNRGQTVSADAADGPVFDGPTSDGMVDATVSDAAISDADFPASSFSARRQWLLHCICYRKCRRRAMNGSAAFFRR